MRKKLVLLCMFLIVLGGNSRLVVAQEEAFRLVDVDATEETRQLYDYLRELMESEKIMFGQQHAIDEGLTLLGERPRVASEESEIFNAVGDYPAVFGWDTLSIDGFEQPGIEGDIEQSILNTVASFQKAHNLGAIITLSTHPHNFVTGGNFNDTGGNVVDAILPGGSHHQEYLEWLDRIAMVAEKSVDEEGQSIPILLRLFHEQNGSWFWWGSGSTSPDQYKSLFRFTVEYLRDVKDVHNFLYVFSPNSGATGDKEEYLTTFPGESYVDIVGIDSYDQKDDAGSESWLDGLVTNLEMVVDIANDYQKVAVFSEFGYSPQGINETGNVLDWYTRVFNAIQASDQAKQISYMLTWANFGFPDNMFVPYRDVNDDLGGDHELLPDFVEFYNDELTLFSQNLEGIYNREVNVDVTPYDAVIYPIRPTAGEVLTKETTMITFKGIGKEKERLTFEIEGVTDGEIDFKYENPIFQAELPLTSDLNGDEIEVTIRHYDDAELISEETFNYYVALEDVVIDRLDFQNEVSRVKVKANGTYPESDSELSLRETDNGLHVQFDEFDASESWQEVKLELEGLDENSLQDTNRIGVIILIPSTATEKYVKAVSQWTYDFERKFGDGLTVTSIQNAESILVDGEEFKRITFTIPMIRPEETSNLAFSVVGENLENWNEFYLENVTLYNQFEFTVDKHTIDNFEIYFGDDNLMNASYASNGDPIQLSLVKDKGIEGEYALSYAYSIATQGYAGKQISLNQNWQDMTGISLWLSVEPTPERELTVQIRVGNVSYEAYIDLTDGVEGELILPFEDFVAAPWENKPDSKITNDSLADASQFALYIGGDIGEGELLIDNIRVVE